MREGGERSLSLDARVAFAHEAQAARPLDFSAGLHQYRVNDLEDRLSKRIRRIRKLTQQVEELSEVVKRLRKKLELTESLI